ncbi:MAG: MMPL family transporter, partial [Solirubrobacteraceae bacterium]
MQQPAAAARHDDAATTITHSALGRLGAWAADHRRAIVVAWCGVVLVLGALAPFADRALSGAGWEALGSESVAARRALEPHFPGRGTYALSVVVTGPRAGMADPTMRSTLARVRAVLRGDAAVAG